MVIVTALHLDLIVEAHGVLFDLVLISAHKPNVKAALKYLSQLVQAPFRVIFSPAFDVLWLVTQCMPSSSDICKRFHVSVLATRARGMHIKPLRPVTVLLAAHCGHGGDGSGGGGC